MRELVELAEKLKDKKEKQELVKAEYKDKEKVKKLTTDERLARLEKLLGVK